MGLVALMSRSDPGLKSDSEGPGPGCRSQERSEEVEFGKKGQENELWLVLVIVALIVSV